MNATTAMTGSEVPTSIRVHRILVPLDFSKDSEKALTYGVSLARQFGAKFLLKPIEPANLLTLVAELLRDGS